MSTYQGLLTQWFPRLKPGGGLIDGAGADIPLGAGAPVYTGVASGRPTAAAAGAGNSIRLTDYPTSKGSTWLSDGTNWHPEFGVVTIASLPGPFTVSGAGNFLVGMTNGAPRILGGLLIPGVSGSRLRIRAELVKIGTTDPGFAGDIRFGTGSNFSDSQLSNLAPMQADGATALADLTVTFPTATSAEVTQNVIFSAGFNPSTGYYPGNAHTTNINTAADMFLNIGYNGGPAGSGVRVKNVLVELFQWG